VNLQKGTRYALCAAAALARAWGREPVTASGLAKAHGLPATVVAKVLQDLARAGLATGQRGTRGGYQLAKAPHRMTLLDVVEAFEPPHPGMEEDRLRRVFEEIDASTRATLASITLETLIGARRDRTGARALPPASEPRRDPARSRSRR
jgi:Rrf2 family protein